MEQSVQEIFDLTGRVAVITGGGGLLGFKHAEVIANAGGIPILVDIRQAETEVKARKLAETFGVPACAIQTDITQPDQVQALLAKVVERYKRVDILINNAANNPKMETNNDITWSRLEHFPFGQWQNDLAVGLTGAYLCSQIIGVEMVRRGRGVILNVASEFALIAPDQRIYRKDGLPEDQQPVKPLPPF